MPFGSENHLHHNNHYHLHFPECLWSESRHGNGDYTIMDRVHIYFVHLLQCRGCCWGWRKWNKRTMNRSEWMLCSLSRLATVLVQRHVRSWETECQGITYKLLIILLWYETDFYNSFHRFLLLRFPSSVIVLFCNCWAAAEYPGHTNAQRVDKWRRMEVLRKFQGTIVPLFCGQSPLVARTNNRVVVMPETDPHRQCLLPTRIRLINVNGLCH